MQKTLLALFIILFLIVSCKLKEEVTDPDTDTGTDPNLAIEFPNGNDSLMVGANYDILWSSTIQSALVLEFSTDNGSTWNTISDSVANTGSYTWGPLPNSKSARCLMRVRTSDGTSSDESDSTWSIVENVNKVLLLTAPSGGEVVQQGGSLDIEWISSKVSTVKIEFSVNNGNTWETIVTNYDATLGKYTWADIPAVNSANCLIRISDLASATVSDVLTNPFTIVIDVNLLLISPNGGEQIEGGSEYEIRWYSKDIANVKLEYSINNGLNWNTIAENLTNTGLYLWNPIPATPTSLAKLRISDISNSANVDVSDTTFSILPEANISIVSPTAGEQWESGSTQYIQWNSKNVANVKIDYSTNNGATWTNIIASTPSIGSLTWEVPEVNSGLCNIRILDASDGRPVSIMESPFTIFNGDDVLEVYAPNGGESWEIGTDQEIRWFAYGSTSLNIEYTTNNGQSWQVVANSVANTGIYEWRGIPNTPSTLAKVRISDADDGELSDESNGTFTITQQSDIQILEPSSGDRLQAGTTSTIRWNSKNVEDVKIDFSTNNGATWTEIVAQVPSNGTYSWLVPTLNSGLCNIRISDSKDGSPSGTLESPFTIFTGEDVLEVYIPNGGESWEIGTDQEIKWFAYGVSSLKLEYTTNNGQTWMDIANNVLNTGSYSWKGIPNTPSALAKVRISDAGDNSPVDMSDATFTISQESQIEVTEPNGGEQLQAGTTTNIQWTSTNVENVKIEFTSNNGASWTTIAESTPSIGFYVWEGLPNISSQQCRIKVSDASDGIPNDVSDANFTVTNQIVETLTITSPNGGEEWQSGISQLITWQSSGVDSVKIEYSLNNGTSWTVIVESIENADAYSWNPVPNVDDFKRASKIRISDAEDGKPVDESNGTFTIKPIPSISLITPNGGEEYEFGETVIFQWESIGVERVMILSTSNNGAIWDTLETSVLNTGTYNRGFSRASSDYKVQIREATTGSPSDESDGTFTVLPQVVKTVTVTQPNGGENWLTSKDQSNPNFHEITWQSNNVERVNIQYTLNGGATWVDIASSIVSNGLYNWRVPENIQFRTDLAKIRITDAGNDNLFDVSDDFFSIHPQVKLLRVEQPVGDEYYFCSEDDPMLTLVTWTSAGISNVKIEYSFNNGATWTTLETSYESSGAYSIPVNAVGQTVFDADSNLVFIADNPTTIGRIRITDATPPGVPFVPVADPSISDVSELFNLGICPAGIKEGIKPNNEAVGRNKIIR